MVGDNKMLCAMKLFTFNLDVWMVVLGLTALRDSTLVYIGSSSRGGGRVVRWCCVNFQCRGVLQFGLQ